MILNIIYRDAIIGTLRTTADQGIVFSYNENATRPISISMDDLDRTYTEKQCMPFFDGLLPEGNIRRQIADLAHVPSTSTIRLLASYGQDIAGALTIVEGEGTDSTGTNGYEEISVDSIHQRLKAKVSVPLIYAGHKTKLSLAGAESKIPLLYKDDRFYLPTGSSPSNYIIKACDEFVQNEYLCTKLASLCSLAVSQMEIHHFGDVQALLIKRYDRQREDGALIRLHQEDFCQALGIMPENKYEESGGPGLTRSLELIQLYSTTPENDIRQFLMMSMFNFLIGNGDAHGKNYSFLYDSHLGERRLAPFYDIVCSSIDERFDTRMAMKISNERRLSRITRHNFESAAPKNLMKILTEELLVRFPAAMEELKGEVSPELLPLLLQIEKDSKSRQEALRS